MFPGCSWVGLAFSVALGLLLETGSLDLEKKKKSCKSIRAGVGENKKELLFLGEI